MATTGIDLGNFKTSVAFQHRGLESRAFFVSVFASKLDHEDSAQLKRRVEGRGLEPGGVATGGRERAEP